jgi:Tol biopolymer transport system component
VFISYLAGITSNASGTYREVFWRDRYTGKTLLVSATVTGVEGNGDSFAPVISADGQTVAFESSATNLVTGDTSIASDIFVWSALAPNAGVTRVSVGPGGVEATNSGGAAASNNPTLSGDGKVIAFESTATNLDP